ncbi:hypothetical protein RhiJN_00599 [Ceratobasidium sp. AG-Ba]|nr:hypothetical protein RhiJN_00599 [Ceratobasidium sp. AG-Ba]
MPPRRLSLNRFALFSGIASLVGHCNAEPPNPLYQHHMNDATAVYNMTLFIIPYPKADVEKLAGYPMLRPPFPFSEEAYPLVYQFGKLVDIRQSLAQIPELMSASIIIPNVDRLKDGKTSFVRSKYTFTDQAIPSIVSWAVEGYRNEVASFNPPHEAFGASQQVYFSQVKKTIVPTPPPPVGGPGLSQPIADALFMKLHSSELPQYPQSVYERLVNGPIFGDGLGCGTITTFFNYTFANPTFVLGNMTLYAGYLPETRDFINVHGLSVTVTEIQGTFPPVDCKSLAA